MIVKTDVEIWLLFAPFWILGLGALIGALTPIGLLPGALVGGAMGAGIGAATTPNR